MEITQAIERPKVIYSYQLIPQLRKEPELLKALQIITEQPDKESFGDLLLDARERFTIMPFPNEDAAAIPLPSFAFAVAKYLHTVTNSKEPLSLNNSHPGSKWQVNDSDEFFEALIDVGEDVQISDEHIANVLRLLYLLGGGNPAVTIKLHFPRQGWGENNHRHCDLSWENEALGWVDLNSRG